jgi:hypothetical protein
MMITAEAHLLDPFNYLDMIEKFASRFGQHPDDVFNNTSFGTIANFVIKWVKEGEFNDRMSELQRIQNPPPMPT